MNSPKRTVLIIGNGPSTKLLTRAGFEKIPAHIDTFGTTNAFRYFERINWWPTYYTMADKKVAFHHREKIAQLIHDPKVTTRKFFVAYPITESKRLEVIDHMCTGTFSLRKCIEMGYEEHLLIGMEGAYVEKLPESRALTEEEFEELGFGILNLSANLKLLRIITKTPDYNPNYFFDDYQQEGDIYSLPRAQAHKNNWKKIIDEAAHHKVKIYNLSPISKIEDFDKRDIFDVFPFLDRTERSLLLNLPSLGPYESRLNAQFNETDAIAELFKTTLHGKNMVNVGATDSDTFLPFLDLGWKIFSFDLDTEKHLQLKKHLEAHLNKNLIIDSRTISPGHIPDADPESSDYIQNKENGKRFSLTEADTISLNQFLKDKSITTVDFLRIDSGKNDFYILKELPWEKMKPTVIECKFNDETSRTAGWNLEKLARFLDNRGYSVYISERHPSRTKALHWDWKQLILYPCLLSNDKPWGVIIAIRDEIKESSLIDAIKSELRLYEKFITYKGSVVSEKDVYTLEPPSRSNWLASVYRGVFEANDSVFCTFRFTVNTGGKLSVKLCRDGNTPFESSNKKIAVKAGENTLELTHRLKYKPEGIKIQIGSENNTLDISNMSANLTINRNGKSIQIRDHRPERDFHVAFDRNTASGINNSLICNLWSLISYHFAILYRKMVELLFPEDTRRRIWAANIKYRIAKLFEK